MSPENNVSNLLKNTPPLTFGDLKNFRSKYERAFAQLLLLRGLWVWREPRLVEITQSKKEKALRNKKKQITNMRKSGLPWMLLTKENLSKIAAANPIYRRSL